MLFRSASTSTRTALTLVGFLDLLADIEYTVARQCLLPNPLCLMFLAKSMQRILRKVRPLVYIQQKRLKCAPATIQKALVRLCTLSCVASLQVQPMAMDDEGALSLVRAIGCCEKLQKLKLSFDQASDRALGTVVDSFASCRALQQLCVQWRGGDATDCVPHALASVLPRLATLKSIDLKSNYLTSEHMRQISLALGFCKNLECLYLPYNSITDDGATCLAKALGSMPALHCLDLRQNYIQDAGMQAVCRNLVACTALQDLNLSFNQISMASVFFSPPLLAKLSTLQVFELCQNNVGPLNAKLLSAGLSGLAFLRVLVLTSSNLQHEGVQHMAERLGSCTRLETLCLAGNNINAQGSKPLAQILLVCSKLRELDVTCNQLDVSCPHTLMPSLAICTSLRTLRLSMNCIPASCIAELERFAHEQELCFKVF